MDTKSFNEKFYFIPEFYRVNYGDEAETGMESFKPLTPELNIGEGNIQDQADQMLVLGEEEFGKAFDFVTLLSKDTYLANSSDAENSGGGATWDAVLVCGFSGFAPIHQICGFEIAGRLEPRTPSKEHITLDII